MREYIRLMLQGDKRNSLPPITRFQLTPYMGRNALHMQFDGKTANIKVSGLEQKTLSNGSVLTKVTAEDGKKYSFFDKKKDGNPTAAAEAFRSVRVGDVVEVGYKEEEKEFAGDKGLVKYTQRTILFANPVHENGNYAVDLSAGKVPTINHDDIVIDDADLPF